MTGDQSRLVPRASAVEALTQIRALCDRADRSALAPRLLTTESVRAVLDAVPVDATPPQGVDRDAARAFLAKLGYADPEVYDIEGMVDELALVRPAAGIVLSPEEAALAAEGVSCIATAPRGFYPREKQARARALQVRLEAAS